ncbi:hypothetical protein GCM10023340_42620 [Nocardioides marinquilinus]|uniref:YdeI/OmpD-associated family protein n=1 Tax=Nocardioides marinquilinus TaxID=1210400 RepID=A0ABP9Q437_9ACTN
MNGPTTAPTVVDVPDADAWRAWLAERADRATEAWLVLPHTNSPRPGPTYEDAVRQAVCFGWIDSTRRRHDEHSSVLRFTPRRPRSRWSGSNRRRVAELESAGLMTARGRHEVDRARERGTWEEG